MLRVQSKCISIERASGLVVWRRPGDEILWILLISLHKSKQHRRCADAIKLEGKKVLKRAADMDGLDSSSQNSRKFVVTAPLRDPSPRLRVVLGARRGGRKSLPGYCPISFSSHLLLLSLGFAFPGFRISRVSTAVTIVVMKSAGFTNFLDAIPRYDRWGSVVLPELIYILAPFQIISHSKNFG